MKVAAILIDTCRELIYRKTLIVYVGLVTLTHLLFILALQTDVADGVIASGSIFSSTMAGLPEASARSKAGANSPVRSTRSPWPPKARA